MCNILLRPIKIKNFKLTIGLVEKEEAITIDLQSSQALVF